MDDLVTWLRGVLDEDERVARAAAASTGPDGAWRLERPDHGLRIEVRSVAPDWPVAYTDLTGGDGEQGAHIARHDPASVLADIAAKRAILDAWVLLRADVHDAMARGDREAAPEVTEYAFEQVVQTLATAYAHLPGYREEWRPAWAT